MLRLEFSGLSFLNHSGGSAVDAANAVGNDNQDVFRRFGKFDIKEIGNDHGDEVFCQGPIGGVWE